MKIDQFIIDINKENFIVLIILVILIVLAVITYYIVKSSLKYYKKIQIIKAHKSQIIQIEEDTPIIKKLPQLGEYTPSFHSPGLLDFKDSHQSDYYSNIKPLKSFKSTYSLQNDRT